MKWVGGIFLVAYGLLPLSFLGCERGNESDSQVGDSVAATTDGNVVGKAHSYPEVSLPSLLLPEAGEDGSLDLGDGMTLDIVWIAPGRFEMGGERTVQHQPVHAVELSKGFWMGKTEVTQGQWSRVMGTTPWKDQGFVKEQESCPAVYVDWDDAKAFCKRLTNALPGKQVRLPSEAEWEYCNRAGSKGIFSFGSDFRVIGQYAWCYDNTYGNEELYAHPVGTKIPNAFGLHDMHGNVMEWCEDTWHDNYLGAPANGDSWIAGGDPKNRVLRDCNWAGSACGCRLENRGSKMTDYASHNTGFRVVITP